MFQKWTNQQAKIEIAHTHIHGIHRRKSETEPNETKFAKMWTFSHMPDVRVCVCVCVHWLICAYLMWSEAQRARLNNIAWSESPSIQPTPMNFLSICECVFKFVSHWEWSRASITHKHTCTAAVGRVYDWAKNTTGGLNERKTKRSR